MGETGVEHTLQRTDRGAAHHHRLLMKTPVSRALVTDLMQEVVNGAKACGADIGDEFVQRMLDNTDHMSDYAPKHEAGLFPPYGNKGHIQQPGGHCQGCGLPPAQGGDAGTAIAVH